MSPTPFALRRPVPVAIVPLAHWRARQDEAVDPRLEPFLQAVADMLWQDIRRELEQNAAHERIINEVKNDD